MKYLSLFPSAYDGGGGLDGINVVLGVVIGNADGVVMLDEVELKEFLFLVGILIFVEVGGGYQGL